ncbi:hypothetical protein Cgig2_031400 [Carnegiea gigantea]|uniref:Uncharacterized protein n=1 Tax=Carnegiea gigantea TaxID=171969 RepID=A0A9Q1K6R1_9CARY|nr:hypothetical protein Cgig2_031400 [Carnegiea gigantea]
MARMARTIGPLICIFFMVMDIIAGILSIQADVAQNREKHIRVWIFECRQPSLEAYKLGLAACVLLAMAHVLANVLGGCVCIRSREEYYQSSPNRQLAAGSLILSWFVLSIAFSLLVVGTVANARPENTCGFSHRHVFVVGGILCFIHGFFLVAYYVGATASAAEEEYFRSQRPSGPPPLPA